MTGAGSGIGQATAVALAREGASVAVNDISPQAAESTCRLIRKTKGRAAAVPGDVSRDEDCRRIVQETVRTLDGLHILINNAGIGGSGTVLSTSEETWDALMKVNLKGVFLLSRAALPVMKAKKSGVIVNTASIAGIAGLPDRAAYCASKAGVVGLTKAMALDHVQDGIRINCICPGTTQTPWIAQRLREAGNSRKVMASLKARQPMGRLGRPEEIAAGILFLASEESSFMTGTALVMDGGFSA